MAVYTFDFTGTEQSFVVPDAPSATLPGNPSVSVLLRGNGASGSIDILDESYSPKTVAVFGNAQISTAQSKYGGSSIAFDGSGDYVSVPGSSGEISFGTGDFTIRAWVWWTSLASESAVMWGNGVGWTLFVYPSGKLQWGRTNPLTPANLLTSTATLTTGAWTHIAITRKSNVLTLWVDGVNSGSTTDGANYSANGTLEVGRSHSGAFFNGWIDDLEITKGVAHYITDFTPPGELQPAMPITAPSDTVLLQVMRMWGGGGASGTRHPLGLAGASPGKAGGYTSGVILATPGETLTMIVGGGGTQSNVGTANPGGYGGGGEGEAGGNQAGGGGGGRSAIRRGSTELMTAHGGGGGASLRVPAYDGADASEIAGGAGGSATDPGTAGSAFQGGAGNGPDGSGGGGGGGYFGGGGGGGASDGGGDGGIGSSFLGDIAGTRDPGTGSVPALVGDAFNAGLYGAGGTLSGSSGGPGQNGRIVLSVVEGSAELTLPVLEVSAGDLPRVAMSALTLPMLEVSSRTGGSAFVTIPSLSVIAFSAPVSAVTLPPLRVSSTGRRSASQGAALFLPAAALTSYGGAKSGVVLPGLQFSGSATGGVVGRAACVLPALRLSATATNPELARASLSFRPLVARAYGGGTAALTLTPIKGGGTGIVGSVARAALTLPALTVVADATQGSMARATLQLPALRMTPLASAAVKLPALRLSATARSSFAVVHEAYVMHMGARAPDAMANQVTRYTGYPFHVIVRFKGENYGVASDGLYLIGGETDDGASIPWRFESCLTDFGVAQKKNVSSAYFAGRLGANVSVKVLAGDAPDKVYAHTTIPVAHAVNHREKLGRGRVTRYFAFGASGSGDLSLDAMEFEINQATRRI